MLPVRHFPGLADFKAVQEKYFALNFKQRLYFQRIILANLRILENYLVF